MSPHNFQCPSDLEAVFHHVGSKNLLGKETMKLATAVKYGLGTALLSSGQAITCEFDPLCPGYNPDGGRLIWGEIKPSTASRKLEEGAPGVEGQVVMWNLPNTNTTTEHFVATNATFPKGIPTGLSALPFQTLRIAPLKLMAGPRHFHSTCK